MVEVVVFLVLEALDLGVGAQPLLADQAVELNAHGAREVGVACFLVAVDAGLGLVVQTRQIAIVRNTDATGELDDVSLGVGGPVLIRHFQLSLCLGSAGRQATEDGCHGSTGCAQCRAPCGFFLCSDDFFHDYPVLKSSEWGMVPPPTALLCFHTNALSRTCQAPDPCCVNTARIPEAVAFIDT